MVPNTTKFTLYFQNLPIGGSVCPLAYLNWHDPNSFKTHLTDKMKCYPYNYQDGEHIFDNSACPSEWFALKEIFDHWIDFMQENKKDVDTYGKEIELKRNGIVGINGECNVDREISFLKVN